MTLDFIYVPGIDDSNLLRFTSIANLNAYMASKIVKSISYSFFPPKYSDAIKVDTTDVNMNTVVNYLRFQWAGKYYYYFIDSTEYINEDVILINIRMDTIMTYYFDIRVNEGIIERKHISRFVEQGGLWFINRNYIRENVSDGVFLDLQKQYTVPPEALKWCVIKITAELRIGVTIKRRTFINSPFRDTTIPLAYGIYVGPWDNKEITIKYTDNVTGTVLYPYHNILYGLADDRTVGIYMLPFNPVEEISYTRGADNVPGELEVNWPSGKAATDCAPCVTWSDDSFPQATDTKTGVLTQRVYNDVIVHDAINLTRNSNQQVAFDKKYIPCLRDENYMRIAYGNENCKVTYPVHTTKEIDVNLIGSYTCNLDDGTITFTLRDGLDLLPTRFSAIAIDDDIPSLSLNNDPWRSYLANIQGRMVSMGINTVSEVADCFISMGASSASAKIKQARITNNKSAWDKRATRNPRLKKRYAEKWHAIEDQRVDEMANAAGGFASGLISTMGSELSTAFVAAYKAPTVRSMGNVLDSDSGYKLAIWYQWSMVEDIDWVALYYHKFGNLVNINYPYNSAWYNEFNNRYYFNYIKFADIIISINSMCEDSVVADIENRFLSGVTMWNPDYEIGSTFQYDNVEN